MSLATHEAGHAVIALALGISISSVTIEPTYDSLGHLALPDSNAGSLRERAMVRLAARSAGAAWAIDTGIGLRDEEQAKVYALEAAGGDDAHACALIEEWQAETNKLALRHGMQIGQVSIALLERGTLFAFEVAEIVDAVAEVPL